MKLDNDVEAPGTGADQDLTVPDLQWERLSTLSHRLRSGYRAVGSVAGVRLSDNTTQAEEWRLILGRMERQLSELMLRLDLENVECDGWQHVRCGDGSLRSFRIAGRFSSPFPCLVPRGRTIGVSLS